MRLLSTGLLLAAGLTAANAQSTLLEVREWPLARVFDEIGTFARWDIMAPVVRLHDVDEADFHACLMVANTQPNLRSRPTWELVDECIDQAKEDQRR